MSDYVEVVDCAGCDPNLVDTDYDGLTGAFSDLFRKFYCLDSHANFIHHSQITKST